MTGLPTSVAGLRELLSERFPQAARTTGAVLPTGIPAIDDLVRGLPRPALTELVGAAPSCGRQLFLGQLLQLTRQRGGRVGLIDGADGFDPASWAPEWLEHLVWVRCRATSEAMAVADLLARDANLELVVLDLRRATKPELRRIPASTWYRLQRAVEQSDLAMLVLTPSPVVPSAQLRLVLDQSHHLADQTVERRQLVQALPAELQRQRRSAAAG